MAFLVVLAIAGGGGWYYWKKKNAEAAKQPEQAVRTAKIERGRIDLRVSTTGKVSSNLDVDIKSKASGQVIKLPYDVSDKVTSGELLAELDPVDENRNVELKMAALASAKARFAQAEENLRIAVIDLDTGTSSAEADLESARIKQRDAKSRLARNEDLFRKNLVSKEQLDAAVSEAAAADNSVRQAEAKMADSLSLPRTVENRKHDIALQKSSVKVAEVDLENAIQRLKETKIYAPMDGVITERKVQTGQIIASGISNVGGGTTLMTLSDVSRIYVNANVDEADIGKVKADQRSIITADAYPGKRFRGKVVRIAPKGTTTNNVVTFEVKIEVIPREDEEVMLKPEMTANVDIQADQREDVLVAPNEAVQFGREGYFVEVPDGPGKTKKVVVKTGITDGLNMEILDGIAEGQELALPSSLQSKWVQGQGGPSLQRGMQSAAFRMSGMGRGGGGRR